MNTLLPYPSFRLSAHVLATRHLVWQRDQGISILRMVAGHHEGGRQRWHTATLMWAEHGAALSLYLQMVMIEIRERRVDTDDLPLPRTPEGRRLYKFPSSWLVARPEMPEWLGHERLHASHRAALLSLEPAWYQQFCWDEPAVMDWFWPGKIPGPGEQMISPAGEVHMVLGRVEDEVECLSPEGERVRVSRRDIYLRRWRIVVEILPERSESACV